MANRDQNALDANIAQANEIQNIMKNNVDKIMERGGKLSDLKERSDQLQAGTEQFHRNTVKLNAKNSGKNMKMKIIIGVIIAVIIIIIIVMATFYLIPSS